MGINSSFFHKQFGGKMEKVLDLAMASLKEAFMGFAKFPTNDSDFTVKLVDDEPEIQVSFTSKDSKSLLYRCVYPAEWQGLLTDSKDSGKTIHEILKRYSVKVKKPIPAFSGISFATVVDFVQVLIILKDSPYTDKKGYKHMHEVREAWTKALEAKVL